MKNLVACSRGLQVCGVIFLFHFIKHAVSEEIKISMKSPKQVNILQPFNVSCDVSLGSTETQNINVIKLIRKPAEVDKEMFVIRNAHLHPELENDLCRRYNMSASLHNKTVRLNLMIEKAFQEDGATYVCKVYVKGANENIEVPRKSRVVAVVGDEELEKNQTKECTPVTTSAPIIENTAEIAFANTQVSSEADKESKSPIYEALRSRGHVTQPRHVISALATLLVLVIKSFEI